MNVHWICNWGLVQDFDENLWPVIYAARRKNVVIITFLVDDKFSISVESGVDIDKTANKTLSLLYLNLS